MDLARRLPLFRRSIEQVERYRPAWEASNGAAREAAGPLWLVLGDSAAQGVGASAHDRGWVGLVLARLRATGEPWRVVNLSRSGARTREVVDVQWPAGRDLGAELVTAVVGGNDALRTREAVWTRAVEDLCTALPPGAVVSTTARGVFERKTRRVNEVVRARAAEHGLRVADLWAHTGPPYRGLYADGFHPNDRGYQQWADALAEALGLT
ncbi:MAG: Lipolytic enzyme precursor [Frankiales bacterium]|nr:Lipolytic enzyme precursor [Frankiales bacterium]MCW2814846.1 Lipolytic enzyme precursor [Nocardioides sp.]